MECKDGVCECLSDNEVVGGCDYPDICEVIPDLEDYEGVLNSCCDFGL